MEFMVGKWIALCLWVQIGWSESDPFAVHKSGGARMQALKKYQYLGFIQEQHSKWALIRCSGGEIEKLNMGKTKGWGKVIRINLKEVCLFKKKQIYCLTKGTKPMVWNVST
jgi:hypothetical protein